MSDNYLDDLFIDEVSGALKPPSGSEPVKDYTQLTNLPRVNGVELKGDKSLEDLGIDLISPEGKTAEDTQAVRKDSDGKLWTKPSIVLNVSAKTEADADYTVEVKIDPVTKKLYVPASTVQTTPSEPETGEGTE